jgi:hypothetical protein
VNRIYALLPRRVNAEGWCSAVDRVEKASRSRAQREIPMKKMFQVSMEMKLPHSLPIPRAQFHRLFASRFPGLLPAIIFHTYPAKILAQQRNFERAEGKSTRFPPSSSNQ